MAGPSDDVEIQPIFGDTNRRTVRLDVHIIGTMELREGNWWIGVLKTSAYPPAFAKPSGALHGPYATSLEAAGACLEHWRTVMAPDVPAPKRTRKERTA